MNTKQTILFGFLALLGGFIGGILSDGLPGKAVAKSDIEKVIRAEKFELVDKDGNERSYLSISDGMTILNIKSKIVLMVDSDGRPMLQLGEAMNVPRLVLGKAVIKNPKTGSTEIRSTGSIVIFDEKGKVVYSVP